MATYYKKFLRLMIPSVHRVEITVCMKNNISIVFTAFYVKFTMKRKLTRNFSINTKEKEVTVLIQLKEETHLNKKLFKNKVITWKKTHFCSLF
jgi:hypothetical protein